MSDHDFPKEPGLYWATDLSCGTIWEFIVELSGEAPFLRCELVHYRECEHPLAARKCPEKLYYGPKIEMPERDLQAIPQD